MDRSFTTHGGVEHSASASRLEEGFTSRHCPSPAPSGHTVVSATDPVPISDPITPTCSASAHGLVSAAGPSSFSDLRRTAASASTHRIVPTTRQPVYPHRIVPTIELPATTEPSPPAKSTNTTRIHNKSRDASSSTTSGNPPAKPTIGSVNNSSTSSFLSKFSGSSMFSKNKAGSERKSKKSSSSKDKNISTMDMSSLPRTEPSPHTHPLLSKPSPRDELHLEHRDNSKGKLKSTSRDHSEQATENFSFDISKWGAYLKYYSEGRFNMSHPPVAPPIEDMVYFRAPIPPSEDARSRLFEQISGLYSEEAIGRAERLTGIARRMLMTRHASLSFVQNDHEVLQVEDGYYRTHISRNESFAAHCILSTEPMVILDTSKDWRFRRNPLVLGGPKVRFYAGAPLVTRDGQIIGVFAVFDPVFRVSFPYGGQRQLVDMAKIAMTDIEMLLETDRVEKVSHARVAADRLLDLMTEEMEALDESRGQNRLGLGLPSAAPRSLERVVSRGNTHREVQVKEESAGDRLDPSEEAAWGSRRRQDLGDLWESPASAPGFPDHVSVRDHLPPRGVHPLYSPTKREHFREAVENEEEEEESSGWGEPAKTEAEAPVSHTYVSGDPQLDAALKSIAEKLRYETIYVLAMRTEGAFDTEVAPKTAAHDVLGCHHLQAPNEFWMPFHLAAVRENAVQVRNNPDWIDVPENRDSMWRQSILLPVAVFRISSEAVPPHSDLPNTVEYRENKAGRVRVAGVVLAAFTGASRNDVDVVNQDLHALANEIPHLKRIVKRIMRTNGSERHVDLVETSPVTTDLSFPVEDRPKRPKRPERPAPIAPYAYQNAGPSTPRTPRIKTEPDDDEIGIAVSTPPGHSPIGSPAQSTKCEDNFF